VSGQLHAPVALFPDIHWTGGWVSLSADTDIVEKGKKSLAPVENRTMAVQPVAILTDLFRLPVLKILMAMLLNILHKYE
jgi:hypothetical protein